MHPNRDRQRGGQDHHLRKLREMADTEAMDDPEFLAERRRVRVELETQPSEALTRRYAELNEEFIRRASAAWSEAAR